MGAVREAVPVLIRLPVEPEAHRPIVRRETGPVLRLIRVRGLDRVPDRDLSLNSRFRCIGGQRIHHLLL